MTTLRLLAEADLIVNRGIRSGLLSYPHGTTFDKDGRPVPKITLPEPTDVTNRYPCLRAFLLYEAGANYRTIAREIRCSVGSIKTILDHGRAIHARQALAKTAGEGGDSGPADKRAHTSNHAQGGPSQEAGKTTPRGGNPTVSGVKRRGQS